MSSQGRQNLISPKSMQVCMAIDIWTSAHGHMDKWAWIAKMKKHNYQRTFMEETREDNDITED